MIGKVCVSTFPFFNVKTGKNEFKGRPVLIIGVADSTDYVALPLSRVTKSEYIDDEFDICVNPADYPRLNLTAVSYIRTHKQTIVNKATLRITADLKAEYSQLFARILDTLEKFNKCLIEKARG